VYLGLLDGIHRRDENGEWKSMTNRELEEMSTRENIVKWITGQRISWLGYLERMEEDRMLKKGLHARTRRDETKWTAQKRMERRRRKRSSSAGSEKAERVGDSTEWRDIVRQAKTHNGL
jgi:hypothetical protein